MRDLLTRMLKLLAQGSRADPRERALLVRELKATIDHELDRRDHDPGEVGY